jgi:DNA-binding MarR family transcriptional regulator
MNKYHQFLICATAIDASHEAVRRIDLIAKKLLEVIAIKHSMGIPMTVGDAMAMPALASPATLHRKIDMLREAELIEMIFTDKNRRTKYLVPTDLANDYFSKMGRAVLESLN